MRAVRLVVDPIACDGYGICHELFPEGVDLDDWGFPIVTATTITGPDVRHAKRAVAACPRLALTLVAVATPAPGRPAAPAQV